MPHLIINPGSTSTRVGVFEGKKIVFIQTVRHHQEDIETFNSIIEQKKFRLQAILKILEENGTAIEDITGIIGIGGLIRPCDGGVYKVNIDMVYDLTEAKYGEHAANLGALIGFDIANDLNIEAYIADPITTDEMDKVARLSGMPEIERLGRSHTLNQKFTASLVASRLNKPYETSKLIVVHLGGGISVTAHLNGRMVDTNNARGEGPFSIDRTGGINAFELAKICYSGKYSREDMFKKINGNGGIVAYLGTRDFRTVIDRCKNGDQLAQNVFDALVYQVAKEIAAMSVIFRGEVDAIVLTGGMAKSIELTEEISKKVNFLAPVLLYPGENEMEALAAYLDNVLSGSIIPKEY